MSPLAVNELAIDFRLKKGGDLRPVKARFDQKLKLELDLFHNVSPHFFRDFVNERCKPELRYRRAYRDSYQGGSKTLVRFQQVANDFFRFLEAFFKLPVLLVTCPAHAPRLSAPSVSLWKNRTCLGGGKEG